MPGKQVMKLAYYLCAALGTIFGEQFAVSACVEALFILLYGVGSPRQERHDGEEG